MKLKTACFTYLLMYAVIAGVIGFAVYRRSGPGGGAIAAALIGGFFVFLGISYILGIGTKIAEARIVGRALNGVPPVDGKKYAAIGRIQPIGGRTITSPFTKTPCVCYGYEITKMSTGRNSGSYRVYHGFALTPSTIQSGTTSIRLLAYPDLQVPKSHPAGLQILQNAQEYVASVNFHEQTGKSIGESFKEWMEQFKDDDGSIKVDDRIGKVDPPLDDAFYMEQIVRPGDEVCVIGLYSAQKGALVPDPKAQLHPAVMRAGDPHKVRAAGYRSAVGYLVGGVFILTLATAGMAALHLYVPPNIELEPLAIEDRFEDMIETRARIPLRKAGYLSDSPPVGTRGWFKSGDTRYYISEASATRDGDTTTVRLNNSWGVLVLGPDLELKSVELNQQPVTGLVASVVEDGGVLRGRLTGPGCRIHFETKVQTEP